MNPFQLLQQLVFCLSPLQFAWTTAPFEPVLARVAVVADEPDWQNMDASRPFALVRPDVERDQEEHPPDVVEEVRFALFVFAENATDQAGGAAVVGGIRKAGGSSRGRGLLQIEPLVRAQILSQWTLGPRLRVTDLEPVVPQRMRGLVAARGLRVVASRLPGLPAFATPLGIKGTGSSGAVSLTWFATGWTTRWDAVGVRVCRVAGATPTTDPTVGVVADLGLVSGYTDAPGAGTWSYSVFVAYDSARDPATGKRAFPNVVTDYSGSQVSGSAFLGAPATATVTV